MQKLKRQESHNRGLRNILVPTDFSAASEKAFQHALDLARQYRSNVILLHVRTASDSPGGTENENGARKNLSALSKAAGVSSRRCQSIVRTGIPFVEITQTADDTSADLIVMGRRDAGGSGTFGNGHTADRVLRYAKCPVLIVTQAGGEFVAMPDA